LIQKNFFFSLNFFLSIFWSSKPLDPDWIRIRIGIQPKMLYPGPDPYKMNTDPQPWFFTLKTDVDVPTERNKKNNWTSLTKRAGSGSGSVNQVFAFKDQDLYKMSRIRNTGTRYRSFYNDKKSILASSYVTTSISSGAWSNLASSYVKIANCKKKVNNVIQ